MLFCVCVVVSHVHNHAFNVLQRLLRLKQKTGVEIKTKNKSKTHILHALILHKLTLSLIHAEIHIAHYTGKNNM